MGNFRPDKKLKRKQAHKRWKKTRNTLENWLKEERNRKKAGLPSRKPPVRPARRRKYPPTEMQIKLAKKIEETREAFKVQKKKSLKPLRDFIIEPKWYQRLLKQFSVFLKRMMKWLKK